MAKKSTKNPLKSETIKSIVISIIVSGITAIIVKSHIAEEVNGVFVDLLFKLRTQSTARMKLQKNIVIKSENPHIRKDIVILGIDEDSIKEFGDFPWTRKRYIEFLQYLNKNPDEKPKAVFFDIVFADRSQKKIDELFYLEGANPSDLMTLKTVNFNHIKQLIQKYQLDKPLAEEIKKNGRVFLTYYFDDSQKNRVSALKKEIQLLKEFSIVAPENHKIHTYEGIVPPISEFLEWSKGAGASVVSESESKVFRRIPLLYSFNAPWIYDKVPAGHRRYLPSIDLLIAMYHFKVKPQNVRVVWGKYIVLMNAVITEKVFDKVITSTNDIEIPINDRGEMFVNYRGGYGEFTVRPFYLAREGKIPAEYFKDKYVLVGVYTRGVAHDFWMSPFGGMFGVEHHANILNSLFNRDFISETPQSVIAVLIFVIGILTAVITSKTSFVKGAVIVLVVMAGIFLISLYLFHNGTLTPPLPLLSSSLLNFIVLSTYKGLRVERKIITLEASYYKLSELDRIKTNFFANISHELRTPLSLSYAPLRSLIKGEMGKLTEKQLYYLNVIYRNNIILLELINNLLDLSKIEAGKMTLNIKRADITEVVRFCTEQVKPAAEDKGLELIEVFPDSPVFVFIDEDKMKKVFVNLLSNSLKFTQKGHIKVEVSEEEEFVSVSVEDTGIGIPEDKLQKIFERFEQAAYSGEFGAGTGIGLSLVNEFVKLHKGEIFVESKLGKGTKFTVKIKKGIVHLNESYVRFMKETEEQEKGKEREKENRIQQRLIDIETLKTNEPKYAKKKKKLPSAEKILVADDNPEMRYYIEEILGDKYDVKTVEDGTHLLKAIPEYSPDLIIIDMVLPDISGIDLVKEIKSDPHLKNIPVVMITARDELDLKIKSFRTGADEYITKPFDSEELKARVDALLRNRKFQIELARKNKIMDEELSLAAKIQDNLLPKNLPEFKGVRFYSRYIPVERIGGDFFDIQITKDGDICTFICDVSGHGVSAAMISSMVKISLTNSLLEFSSPSDVLKNINKQLYGNIADQFATSFIMFINAESGLIRYSSAAHPHPILFNRRQKKCDTLYAKGRILGYFDEIKVEERTIQVENGDRILLFTDGITECYHPVKGEFGEDRLMKFIEENRKLEGEEFLSKLVKEVQSFLEDTPIEDDITLVLIDF